mgnify:CR=1 FL=1
MIKNMYIETKEIMNKEEKLKKIEELKRKASELKNWTQVVNWKPTDGASTRKQYVNLPA